MPKFAESKQNFTNNFEKSVIKKQKTKVLKSLSFCFGGGIVHVISFYWFFVGGRE